MKKKVINISIICILTLIATMIGIAYAKYVTTLHGKAEVKIASWSFKVNGQSSENFTINLADTRTGAQQQANVEDGFVGPGTSGVFKIIIDGTGSEVSIEYDINMDIDVQNNEKFPKNLIFYSDSEMENAIYHGDNSINLNGYILQSDTNKASEKMIYWRWDYETGQTEDEKNANDISDSEWMGKNVSLNINVTGRQVAETFDNNQCEIVFDANGGVLSGYGNATKTSKTVSYGEQYGDLPVPVREGYTFAGWSRNLADLINNENYTIYNYDKKTSSEIRNDYNFGGLISQNYIRIYGNEGNTYVDTMWTVTQNNLINVKENKTYLLMFYVRTEKSIVHQYMEKYVNAHSGKTYITWNNGKETYLKNEIDFKNDGKWHLLTETIIVPTGATSGKICIGNDIPNLYGEGSYFDVASIQFYEGETISPYYIESNTVVNEKQNHILVAKWIKD